MLFGGAACGQSGDTGPAPDGKALFEKNCKVCHPDGGNIITANKTLKTSDLNANNIGNVDGIVGKMRNPGTGMSKFDEKAISDAEAKAIAEYILKTFK
jgi:cytochrome c6